MLELPVNFPVCGDSLGNSSKNMKVVSSLTLCLILVVIPEFNLGAGERLPFKGSTSASGDQIVGPWNLTELKRAHQCAGIPKLGLFIR